MAARYAWSKPLWRSARSRNGCIFIARNSSMATVKCPLASARILGRSLQEQLSEL